MLKSNIGCHLDLKSTVNDTKHHIVKKCHLSTVQEEDDPEQCTVNQDLALTDIVNDPSPCFSIYDYKYENINLDVPNPVVGNPKTTGNDLSVDGPMPVPLLPVTYTPPLSSQYAPGDDVQQLLLGSPGRPSKTFQERVKQLLK